MARVVSREESQLRLHADGTWYHQGEPATHDGIKRFFSRQIRKDEAGELYLYNSIELPEKGITLEEHVYFEVEDTAFFVQSLSLLGGGGLRATLNTDEEVEIDPASVVQDEEGHLYCRLPSGDEARLSRHALTQLEPWLEERDDGVHVRVGAASHPIGARG